MSTINVPTLSGAPKPNGSGVSLSEIKAQMEQQQAEQAQSMQAQMEAFQAQMAAILGNLAAAKTGGLAVPVPAIAKVAAQPVNAPVVKAGQPMKLSGQAAEKEQSNSGKPCGAKSPNGLCQKCKGPFHPVLHYSLEAILPMDGSEQPITHQNWKSRRFLGISVDGNYWGNVVIVGFGKDCLNLRPKNAIALAMALMGKPTNGGRAVAASHIEGVLKANGAESYLARD